MITRGFPAFEIPYVGFTCQELRSLWTLSQPFPCTPTFPLLQEPGCPLSQKVFGGFGIILMSNVEIPDAPSFTLHVSGVMGVFRLDFRFGIVPLSDKKEQWEKWKPPLALWVSHNGSLHLMVHL